MKSQINFLVRPRHIYKILAIAILGCAPIFINSLLIPKACKKPISKADTRIESSIIDYKRVLKFDNIQDRK